MQNDVFKFIMPAQLEKASDGEWKIRGLASTENVDQQGEIIIQKGIDLTPVSENRGYFNFDHQPGPENLVGVIDSYNKTNNSLYVSGRLFKNHTKAKAIYEIMSSLGKSDVGRCGLSIEGSVVRRNPKNPKIIEKCIVKNVAITFAPVNADTACELVKSLKDSEIEFNSTKDNIDTSASDVPVFTANQVMSLLEKALGVGSAAATETPSERTGGDALAQESLEDEKPKKKLKKLSKQMYKSQLFEILDQIQKLYPDNTRTQVWTAIKDRMERKFPELNQHS